ncbi:hypothetical protein HPB49_011930 [Dermacentor silvarum]|uniref:Uncharacterized protein n=1 Tax=Dermacentor silvarum TaxID=543639 RepID=A0ACB8C8Z8_DERSI|nr:hypothetical protein HPB49_011930 [Dermacentor silvarum]
MIRVSLYRKQRLLQGVRQARPSTRRVPKTGDQTMPHLQIEEPKQRTRMHGQVSDLRRGAPHGRPNVQGKIQVAAHSEAEKVAAEKQSRKGTHIRRRKGDPSADPFTIGVQYGGGKRPQSLEIQIPLTDKKTEPKS